MFTWEGKLNFEKRTEGSESYTNWLTISTSPGHQFEFSGSLHCKLDLIFLFFILLRRAMICFCLCLAEFPYCTILHHHPCVNQWHNFLISVAVSYAEQWEWSVLSVYWKDWCWSWTPILWPPVKNWLIGKDPDAGKDWREEEKEMTEDEMVGWHHQVNGHELG